MRWTTDDIPDLSGRIIAITGANSGLGFETTLALAKANASVIMACRNSDKGEAAAAKIRAQCSSAQLELLTLNLANLGSIEKFARLVADRTPKLDVLCNNAGVMAIPYRKTDDGFEMQFGTNHLGHFALTLRLLPLLRKAEGARVVTVSSLYHRFGRMRFDDLTWEQAYDKWKAYSMSKLANLLFAYELQRRLDAADLPVISAAAHPGYSATNLQHVGPTMTGSSLEKAAMTIGNASMAQSAARGALPELYAATAPDVKGGEYFGPRGPMEMWGTPRRVNSNEHSKNREDAARLWELSETLTGVKFDELASQ